VYTSIKTLKKEDSINSVWQDNISDAVGAFSTEVGNLISNPISYLSSGRQFFLSGQLHAMQTFASVAHLSSNSPFMQTLDRMLGVIRQVIELQPGVMPSSSLLSFISNTANDLASESSSIVLTKSQFYKAMSDIINTISSNLPNAVNNGSNSFNELIGQSILLFNISVFQGPADPSGYRPITEPNLNNILDSIAAMDTALNSNPKDPSWVQGVMQDIQTSLSNLKKECP
jgi:hypothetical protein